MLLYCPNGPFILFKSVEESRLKFGLQKGQPFQVRGRSAAHSTFINYKRFSDINRVIRLVARLKNISRSKTFIYRKCRPSNSTAFKNAKDFVVTVVQKFIKGELKVSSS